MKKLHLLICLLAAGLLSTFAADEIPADRARQIFDAAPAKPQASPLKPRRVLIWVTRPHLMEKDPHKGYCIPYGTAAFEALGKKTGAYQPVISDDLAVLLPQHINQFDAIVLNNASGPWITPTDADMQRDIFKQAGPDKDAVEQTLRRSFLDFISNGGGLVSIHFAVAANRHWPEFKDLMGATFTGHPWNEDIAVTVEDGNHPLVAAFGGKNFRLADEIYEYGPPYDRRNVRVLLSLDPSRSNMGVRWINRKDNDHALAWVKSYGKGRVFNTSFGHRTEIYFEPRFLGFYLDAVQYATGDLAASAEPLTAPPPRNIPGSDPAQNHPGFVSLFNGRDLSGWNGDTRFWTVHDGAIVGETKPDLRLTENNFLVWKDELEDFELRLKFKLEGGNSGIYYRARKAPPNQKGDPIIGPQADISADGRWTGVIMEYLLRDVLAERGQKVTIDPAGKKQITGSVGDPQALLAAVRANDWNDYKIVAKAGRVVLSINDKTMCELDDHDQKRPARGWLALQIHVGPPMRVHFKDIYLQRLANP